MVELRRMRLWPRHRPRCRR